jgi:MFS transporter, MHS family, shikimate and dehydroshikimate transport protein
VPGTRFSVQAYRRGWSGDIMVSLAADPAFFTAVGLKLSEISYAQIGTVFAISYVTGKLAMPRGVILNAIFLSAVVALAAIPLFGWLSDKIGRKRMFYASSLFAMAFAFPMFWLFRHE